MEVHRKEVTFAGWKWGGGSNREIAGGLAPSGRRIPQEQSLGDKKNEQNKNE